MAKVLLDSGNVMFLRFEYSKFPFTSFFEVHQKLQLWCKILTTKRYFWVQKRVASLIKTPRNPKQGSNSVVDLHIIYLFENLLKTYEQVFSKSAPGTYLKFC